MKRRSIASSLSHSWRLQGRPVWAARATRILSLTWIAWALTVSAATGASDEAPWVPPSARAEAGISDGEPRLRGRLLIDANRSTLDTVRIGVLFDLDPGWHMYWRNPGDSGIATQLEINVPGAEIGAIEWPVPTTFKEGDGLIITYGYQDRVLLMNELRLDPDYQGPRPISVTARVLICKTECIPASFSVSRSLTHALVNAPENAQITSLFEASEQALPVAPSTLGVEPEILYSQSGLRPGDSFDAGLAIRSCIGVEPCTRWELDAQGGGFFPETESPIRIRSTGLIFSMNGPPDAVLDLIGEVDPEIEPAQAPSGRDPPWTQSGVLTLRNETGQVKGIRIDVPIPLVATDTSVTSFGAHWRTAAGASLNVPDVGLLEAALLALLGGLILNLMPCVLPILAIKVFAVTEFSGQSRKALANQGLAYMAGILVSMLALAGAVVSLRTLGTQVGWGFQFQSPLFICLIAILLISFALNLFGVFEISGPGGPALSWGREGTKGRRSFFEGLLAVALATPCSAPFLGTAVGFAFASSPAVILVIFVAVGIGLGMPFLIVSLIPGAARMLPKPGPWMHILRGFLGFSLLATVVWLLWLIGSRSGTDGLLALIILLLAVSFSLFLYGAIQTRSSGPIRILIVLVWLAAAIVGAQWTTDLIEKSESTDQGTQATNADEWEAWSPAAVDAALSAGQTVFVVFSADWCITCQVNERFVLAQEEIRSAFERLNVQVLKADWTERDEGIRSELARFGRAGVPLYLVYDPAAPGTPTRLPELLSINQVVEALPVNRPPER